MASTKDPTRNREHQRQCCQFTKYVEEIPPERSCCNMINQVHYNGVTIGAIASQITSLTSVYSIVYSDADQRKHHSSASLASDAENVSIWWCHLVKLKFISYYFLAVLSFWNFAQRMIVILPCTIQNFKTIVQLKRDFAGLEFQMNFYSVFCFVLHSNTKLFTKKAIAVENYMKSLVMKDVSSINSHFCRKAVSITYPCAYWPLIFNFIFVSRNKLLNKESNAGHRNARVASL